MRAAPDAPELSAVLMIVSGYPPDLQYPLRSVLFAKYLPQFGWRPVVMAPGGRSGAQDGIAVLRCLRPPSPSSLRRLRPSPASFATGAGSPGAGPASGLLRRTAQWLETPDALAPWIPVAVVRGLLAVRRYGVRAVHASGPPFSVALAGLLISRIARVPLVADFRDAWTLDTSDPFGTIHGTFRAAAAPRRVRLLERLESMVARAADQLLFTSRATAAAYVRRYPFLAGRSQLIFNGFDPDDFVEPVAPIEPPTIAHVGSLHDYQRDQAQSLLRGMRIALDGGSLPTHVRLAFVGPVGVLLGRALDETVHRLGLAGHVFRSGFVEHHQAVNWIRGSRALLLLAGSNPYIRLSKISEYVAARRPMLAIAAPGSETANEVFEHGGTVLSNPTDEQLAAGLAATWNAALASAPPCPGQASGMAHPHPLNRKTEAAALAELLGSMVRDRSRARGWTR